jgi:hypothetical protein
MEKRAIIFLILFLADAGGIAVQFAGFLQWYILPTMGETTKSFPPVEMKREPVAGSGLGFSTAESPNGVEFKSVLFGNVTLCCVPGPSAYPPTLFILTSDQMSSWKDHGREPKEWMAKTTTSPPLNYTFSGPEGQEILTFSVVATSSGVYHFVVYAPTQEKPTLNLSVRTLKLTESLTGWAVMCIPAIVGIVGLFLTYRDRES